MIQIDSIRWRLILGSLAATGAPLLGFTLVFAALLWDFFTDHLEDELKTRAGVLSEDVADAMGGGEPDVEQLEVIVDRWRRYSNVRVTIVDRDGLVRAATYNGFAEQVADEERQPGLRHALLGQDNGTVW